MKNLAGIVVFGIILIGLVVSLSGCVDAPADVHITGHHITIEQNGSVTVDVTLLNLGSAVSVTVWTTAHVVNEHTDVPGNSRSKHQRAYLAEREERTITFVFYEHELGEIPPGGSVEANTRMYFR